MAGLFKKKGFPHSVSMDVGTFGSGFAVRTKSGQVVGQSEWAGSGSLKTQTDIVLDQDGNLVKFGSEAAEYYMEAKDQVSLEYYSKFKMRIFNPADADPKCSSVDGLKKRPITLLLQRTMEFLSDEALKVLQKEHPETTKKEIRWVITVPAIWTPAAKIIVRNAAKQAGLWSDLHPDQLLLCLEPEAAALDCLDALLEMKLQEGDEYVLCDAGGGTADFVVHRIASEGKVIEVLSASGGPWGSTYVNQAFEEKLDSMFTARNMTKFKENYSTDWIRMLRSFESEKIKKRTLAGKKMTIKVVIPNRFLQFIEAEMSSPFSAVCGDQASVSFDESASVLVFNHEACASLLDWTITKMCDHTEGLMKNSQVKQLKAVVVVGGYAESTLLKDRLKSLAQNAGVLFYCPREPSLSIVKGALKFSVGESLISGRVSPYSYGLEVRDDSRSLTRYFEIIQFGSLLRLDQVVKQPLGVDRRVHRFNIYCTNVQVNKELVISQVGVPDCRDPCLKFLAHMDLEFEKFDQGTTSAEIQFHVGGTEFQVYVMEPNTENFKYVRLELNFS